jgi:CRISPR-associated endonuclease/helicase Cas3
MQTFEALFEKATSHRPYLYQTRLAETPQLPKILNVPTGVGKTSAVFFSWLWRRRYHGDERVRKNTSKRLVYCLPMRVLVEQTRDNIAGFLKALDLDSEIELYVLMGGEDEADWSLYPEKEAILIGTQDMLLSRALNRGYAMSRFRWPVPFGLLNNDVQWVVDEVQLMGAGVPTTTQLDSFRRNHGTFGPVHTMWMSATVETAWLSTVDHPAPEEGSIFILKPAEREEPRIKKGLEALKTLGRLELKAGATTAAYPKELAEQLLSLHRAGTQSIVIANTVNRARDIYTALQKVLDKKQKEDPCPETLLIHSRFRSRERREKLTHLLRPVKAEGPGRIVVSTQVIEAGVDISSALLITELAPWASIVQRFGRCNRYGEITSAAVNWIDLTTKAYLPYDENLMNEARLNLQQLEGFSVAPGSLPPVSGVAENMHVLRRKDLFELFDTAPDLSGSDVDISRFIRDGGETSLYLCWRDWPKKEALLPRVPAPRREELCPVPVGQFREYMREKKAEPWIWDYRDRRWRRIYQNELFPGQQLILHSGEGGYDIQTGWNPSSKIPVEPLAIEHAQAPEAGGDDPYTFSGNWQTLAGHSAQAVLEMKSLTEALGSDILTTKCLTALVEAVRWHDLGKAHPVFQETLLAGLDEDEKAIRAGQLWAKAPRTPGRAFTHSRPHFRHELASLLALLYNDAAPQIDNLTLYLIAAHHGKVRLAIRSIPGSDGHRYASAGPTVILGIEEGDILPAIDLGEGYDLPPVVLSLRPAEMGSDNGTPSWLSITLELLESLGPFRLAYLEALVRTADIRASIKAQQGVV